MTPGPREWTLGSNTLHFEPPDLFHMDFRGTFALEDAMQVVAILREHSPSGPFILVGDMKEADPPDLQVGRYVSEHLLKEWTLASIYIGARLVHKATAKGIVLAYRLEEHEEKHELGKIYHVATRAQADALIVHLRAQRGARVA